MLSEPSRTLLRAVLRARPNTEAALTELAVGVRPTDAAACVRELTEHGFLRVEPTGSLTVVEPQQVVERELRDHLVRQGERAERDRRCTAELVGDLQDFTRAWAVGSTPGDTIEVAFVHGPLAPRDANLHLQQARGIHPAWASIPDAHRLEGVDPSYVEGFRAAMAAKPSPDRILVGSYDSSGDEVGEALDFFASAGVEIRIHESLPSWFAVDEDDNVVLPVAWGDAWPTSVMILHDPAVAATVRHLYAMLWAEAVPLDARQQSWRDLVQLMATGMSLTAAARTLGCSERTARRRLDQAMRYHRVSTLFQLGVVVGRGRPMAADSAVRRAAGRPGRQVDPVS